MSEPVKGIIAMFTACCIWGLSALYYRMIADVPPLEVLSHRTVWSGVLIGLVLILQGNLRPIPRHAIWRVAIATVMISVNWFFFIYAVQVGEVAQSSLGYYIFPLVAVALGAIFLGERLSRLQWIAVCLAAAAVLMLSIGVGRIPYISLALALSFGFYGLIKKPLKVGPIRSVFWEVVFLMPLALIWIYGVHVLNWQGITSRDGGFFGQSAEISALLAFSGVLTALPLILMAYAMERLRYATVGLVQYINPTLQFLLATVIFMEPFGGIHLTAFAMIWTGLALYSYQALRQDKA